jgi:hypothetical protein
MPFTENHLVEMYLTVSCPTTPTHHNSHQPQTSHPKPRLRQPSLKQVTGPGSTVVMGSAPVFLPSCHRGSQV